MRVSVVVDSRATTLQASTRGGLGRDVCDYFGADDFFSWIRIVFDLIDTCHRSLILTQYLHLHYASPQPSGGLSTRTDDRCKQAERVTQDNTFVIPFVETTCSVWSGEHLISVKLKWYLIYMRTCGTDGSDKLVTEVSS